MARPGTGIELDDTAFRAALNRRLDELEVGAAREVKRTGDEVLAVAKTAAPKRTGKLSRSGRATAGKDARGPYVDVGFHFFTAHFYEFGTSRQSARPFLRPALEQTARILSGRRIG